MRRTRQRDTREHGSSRERGPAPVTGEAATPRRRDPVGAVHAAAGNQAVQRQQQGGPALKGEQWGGRGYREPTMAERERGFSSGDVEGAVSYWLRNGGISPPSSDLDMTDYLDIDRTTTTEGGTPSTSARIRVGPNGNLLPTMATIEERRPEGGYEEGSLQTATTWIQFEFREIPDGGLQIQVTRLDAKQKPTGMIIATTKAAETDLSTRGRENYTLQGDERIPTTLENLIESAGIEVGSAAGMRVPDSARDQSDGEPTIQVPERGVDMPTKPTIFGSETAPFQAGPGLTGVGMRAVHAGGDTYTVQEGDTLSSIAAEQYGDPQKWPVIFMANEKRPGNPTGIEDPDLIHPEDELTIPPQHRAEQFDYASWEPPSDLGVGEGSF